MKYQSFSRITKTYHGVTFHPGDIKDVNGYINDKNFVRLKDDKKQSVKEKSSEDNTDERPVRKQQKVTKQNDQHKEDKKIEKAPVSDKPAEEKTTESSVEKKENVSD